MIKRTLLVAVGLSVCSVTLGQNSPVAAPPAAATQATTTTVTTWSDQQPAGALTQDAIETAIADAGYKEVEGLKFKAGVWRGKARGGNKKWSKLAVGPVTGRVYPADAPSKLNKDEVEAKLTTAGYLNVKDVTFDEGLWSADAQSSQGTSINLLVDPVDGSVVAKSHD